ncbi:contact-dependent growth inhibition system immunity protein [Neisseriaceae bacterium TC5R-5]|nr:contact-dependent growth inhibition system immunity protein [Neisseriaceae bacterium TC5R-5]
MEDTRKLYPNLHLLFGAYLMQDWTLWGSTIEDVILRYKKDMNQEECQAAIHEIDEFINRHPNDLNEYYEELFGEEISIEAFGYSPSSFLEYLKYTIST